MKHALSIIQTALLGALCLIGVLIFLNTQEPSPDPAEALRETLSEMN